MASRDKVFLDTDVALDHLADRQPFADGAAADRRLSRPMKLMVWSLRMRCWIYPAAAALTLIIVRLTVPISPNGDWMGPLTKCACGMYSFDRFQDGLVVGYGHGGEPTDSPRAFGTYTKIGWNLYRWDAPGNTTGSIIVRP